MNTKKRSLGLAEIPDKEGRLDCLLHSVANMITTQLEKKTNLPGLRDGLMPILEDEIRKNVPAGKVIPEKYKGLAKMVGQHLIQHTQG